MLLQKSLSTPLKKSAIYLRKSACCLGKNAFRSFSIFELDDSLRWSKRTKQIATLGPASSTDDVIEKLFVAGADVFRLNFSHGEHEEKVRLIGSIRYIEKKYGRSIGILGDLQGPKQRCGKFNDGKVTLEKGQTFRFDLDDIPGDNNRVQLPHPEIVDTLRKGDILLLDDGKLRMTVTESGAETNAGTSFVETVVDVGGTLSDRKGVNTPTVTLPISPLTPKDRIDLQFAMEVGIDWLALSFVQKAEDMIELGKLVDGRMKLMAKIEKPQAVDAIDGIIAHSDGVMVARGDLGVEMPPWVVPIVQKQLIQKCRAKEKPVVVATQMLESMITSPTPTRAEASDVATAIFDGADAVMLSGESAAGLYPVEAVQMQQRVINTVENDQYYTRLMDSEQQSLLNSTNHTSGALRSASSATNAANLIPNEDLYHYGTTAIDGMGKGGSSGKGSGRALTPTDGMTLASRQMAITLGAKAIVCFTQSGTTVHKASKLRPPVPIVCITPYPRLARSLAMSWGVHSLFGGGKTLNPYERGQGGVGVSRIGSSLNDGTEGGSSFGGSRQTTAFIADTRPEGYGSSIPRDDAPACEVPVMPARAGKGANASAGSSTATGGAIPGSASSSAQAGGRRLLYRGTGGGLKSEMRRACALVLSQGIAHSPGDMLVVTAGLPFGIPGIANVLRVIPAGGPDYWVSTMTNDDPDM